MRRRRRGQRAKHEAKRKKKANKADDPIIRVKKEEEEDSLHIGSSVVAGGALQAKFESDDDKKPVIQPDSSESEWSDDVSPLDVSAYEAQIARRKAREHKADRVGLGQAKASSSKLRTTIVKTESLDNGVPQSGVAFSRQVKEENAELRSRAEESDDEDDLMPDLPMDDPRYLAWTQGLSHKVNGRAVPNQAMQTTQSVAPLRMVKQEDTPAQLVLKQEDDFKPYQQQDAKPHYEIKSAEQAAIGAHKLGVDEKGRDVEIPASINRFLRSYQRDGVRFFWEHYRRGEGGLLGDDMGLGKTIQVISFLAAIMRHRCTPEEEGRRMTLSHGQVDDDGDLGPTALVIAPASVVDNWAREINTWTYLTAETYIPAQEKTRRLLKDFRRGRVDIIVCGMDAARNHIGELAHLDFSCIFIDEVHRVKNPLSQTSINFQTFACKRRFGLTGTAMQNRYAELHVVLDWCFPGRLGDRAQWKDYVESPLKEAQRKDATQKQLAVGRVRSRNVTANCRC
jgi:hypothetical protein